jgi:cytochrome P450
MGATTLRPSFQAARSFGADPLVFLRERAGCHDTIRLHLGFTEFIFVTEPELIKQILVSEDSRFGEGKWTQRGRLLLGDCIITQEGASHAEIRKLIQPGFRDFDSATHSKQMSDAIEHYTRSWTDGDIVEMRTEMAQLALAISGVFLFDQDPQEIHAAIFEDLWLINNRLSRPPFGRREVRAALVRIQETARQMRRGRLLQRLMAAGLAEAAIDREIIALMVASIDTTPGTLAWIWTLLGQNPDVSGALHRELEEKFAGSPPKVDDLGGLSTLKNIMMEVLRLQPPVRFVDRRALEGMTLGEISISAGDYILMSPLFNHRDERYWDRPDDFEPGRWVAGGRSAVHRFAYFPFGAGPHACIGGALAQREIGMLISTLAQRWEFHTVGASPNPHLVPPRFEMKIKARK